MYKDIVIESWDDLCNLAKKGEFVPHQEQDVVCMMYHLCLNKIKNSKLLHASSSHNYDLIVGELSAEKKKDQILTNNLLAEFKFILRAGRKDRRLKGAKKDILKLTSQANPTVEKIFAIYDKASCVKPAEIEELRNFRREVIILFYS